MIVPSTVFLGELGLGWFDPNFEGNILRAYDARGGLLESANPALFPPSTGGEAFIGIRRGAVVVVAPVGDPGAVVVGGAALATW